VPPIYCINLAARPDRWRWMGDVAAKAGLVLKRIEAVDARAPESQAAHEAMIKQGPVGQIGPGARACSLSHAKAWRTFLDDGGAWAVFLEDDVILGDDFARVVDALALANPALDLLKLEAGGAAARGLLLGKPLAEMDGRRLRRCYQLATDSAGYMLSRRGAERALARIGACNVGVDHFLFYPLDRKGGSGLAFAMLEPAVVTQDREIGSDIAAHRHDGSAFWRQMARGPYEAAPIPSMIARLAAGARFIKAPFRA
jgi:glycosyl transferase family 25